MSTSKDNNNGVGVKADILCSTGATAKVKTKAKEALQTRNHTQVIMSPWTCPVDRTRVITHGEQMTEIHS